MIYRNALHSICIIFCQNDYHVMKSEQITVRFTPEQFQEMDKLIASGDFGNRTEFIQYAVRKMLKSFKERYED